MAIDTVLKEFKSVIRSLNWYLKRNKQYDTKNFDTWKKNNGTTATAITAALTDFSIDDLVTAVETYFNHVDTNSIELDHEEKYFLANFENLELFMINEVLRNIKQKQSVQEDITNIFQKINLNLNVTIENLDGSEDEIEDWFESFERIGNSNGWTNDIKAFKIPCYLKDTALFIWQNCSSIDKKDFNALKTEILSKLRPTDSLELLFYSRVQKEAETTMEFGLRLEKLARKAFGAINKDKEILKVFWDGLKMDIRKLTVSASPKDIKEALEIAGKAEKLLVGSKVIKEINKVTEVHANTTEQRSSRHSTKSASPHSHERRRQSSLSISPYRSYKEERFKSPYRRQASPEKRCYNCGRMGHMARECQYRMKDYYNNERPRRKENSNLKNVTCYRCNKQGHLSSNCYSKNY